MKIRKATLKDVAKIYELGKSIKEFKVSKKTIWFWPKSILRTCINSKNNFILIAEDKEIIGFIIINFNPSFKKAIIENILIHPNYREQGIGKILMKNAITELKKLKCEYICFLTHTNNNSAIKLCKEAGFNKGANFTWMDKILNKKFTSN